MFVRVRQSVRKRYFFVIFLARERFPTHVEKSCQGLKIERFFETISQAIMTFPGRIEILMKSCEKIKITVKEICERDQCKIVVSGMVRR